MKKHLLLLMMPLLAGTLFVGCGDDDDETTGGNEEIEDTRINNVFSKSLQDSLRQYMPIYNGTTPPNVEGTYQSNSLHLVYSSDNLFQPGREVVDNVMRFSNQNMTANTVDFDWYEGQNASEGGNGIFISGSGNNFTAFFSTTGTYYGTSYKAVRLYSGTKASNGIRNMYYAIVMLETGTNTSGHAIMAPNTFRVIRETDGLCSPTTWAPPTSSSAKLSIPTDFQILTIQGE